MKKVFFVIGMALVALGLNAQNDVKASKKSEMRVKIIEKKDGKETVQEKVYQLDGNQKNNDVTVIMDSSRSNGGKGNRKMHVIIDDEADGTTTQTFDFDADGPDSNKMTKRKRVYRYKTPKSQGNNFNFDDRAFADAMKGFGQKFNKDFGPQFERQMQVFSDGMGDTMMRWDNKLSKPSTVRGLDAFPNNPEKNELNVRFHAPNKGDVLISVTDTKGKQIAKKEVKDFSGDFVGQISLDKNSKGTYFITVTQNEDGAVKRVVVD